MKMGRTAWLADLAHLLAPGHTFPRSEHNAVGFEMAIKREDRSAVFIGVAHDDHPLVTSPTKRLRVGNQTVAYTVNRLAQVRPTAGEPPIFPGMVLVVSPAIDAKISATPGNAISMGRIEWKIEQINSTTGRIAVRSGLA